MSYLGLKPSPELFAKFAKSEEIFLCPDVAFLVPTKTMGAGVFARCPLPAGTVVISCPISVALSPYEQPSLRAPCVEVLQGCFLKEGTLYTPRSEGTPKPSPPDHLSSSDPFFYMVMRLMAELCRPRSPWRLWLEACPRMPRHFFNLSDAQKTYLLGDSQTSDDRRLWTGVSEQLKEVDVAGRWAMAQLLMKEYPSLWPAQTSNGKDTTFELFCECLAHVLSRNFHREQLQGREGPYLLPGLDFLNHSFTPNTTFEVRGGGRKHEAAFTVVTNRPLVKGEQVYVSYGECGAARMVTQFQFINEPVRQRDKCRFAVNVLVGMALALRQEKGGKEQSAEENEKLRKELERRIDHLQRLGIVYDEGLYLSRPLTNGDAQHEAALQRYWTKMRDSKGKLLFVEDSTVSEEDDTFHDSVVQGLHQEVRFFCITFYLLIAVEEEVFDDIYRRMNKSWTPPQESASIAAAATKMKQEVAQQQLTKVEEMFPGNENTVRRFLLRSALQSEMDTLKFFMDTFFTC
ncbi:hypothetical protein AGDE_06090 [Angomonas deanei]|nr:hypothetical protein AGDE_06090 [Angomonas deanei]|eukprot:EPY37843.1 hypothetical protein AGDE_06090 [Angomonas deanei]